MVKNFRATVVLILISVFSVHSQTYISSGEVSGSWVVESSPYIVEGDIYIGTDERLKIMPGVEVVFTGAYAVEVYGRLEAVGTLNDSIYFTVNDTAGFTMGNNVNWYGIAFLGFFSNSSEPSKLIYCNVEFSSGSGVTTISYKNLLISHSTFRNNKAKGILLMEFSDITMDNVVIEKNGNGGLSVQHSAPQVSNYIIRHNKGTGLAIMGSSFTGDSPVFTNGVIHHNSTSGMGGGIFVSSDVHLTLLNTEIHSNTANKGAGIYGSTCTIVVNDAKITGNSSLMGGGLYLNEAVNADLRFAVISYNYAGEIGGGVYNDFSKLITDRTTIAYNYAGLEGGGLYYNIESNTNNTLSNSIVWDNYPDAIKYIAIIPSVSYSNIMGGFPGTGIIDADPLFEDPINNNLRLTWEGFPGESNLKSPCIDSGDPLSELDPDQTIADMGAFYFEQYFFTNINTNKSNDAMITVFPNPATNQFMIEASSAVEQVRIMNLSGQMVRAYHSSLSEYQIADLIPGVYLIQILMSNGDVTTRKLIKN